MCWLLSGIRRLSYPRPFLSSAISRGQLLSTFFFIISRFQTAESTLIDLLAPEIRHYQLSIVPLFVLNTEVTFKTPCLKDLLAFAGR